jgi:hypothetical protein
MAGLVPDGSTVDEKEWERINFFRSCDTRSMDWDRRREMGRNKIRQLRAAETRNKVRDDALHEKFKNSKMTITRRHKVTMEEQGAANKKNRLRLNSRTHCDDHFRDMLDEKAKSSPPHYCRIHEDDATERNLGLQEFMGQPHFKFRPIELESAMTVLGRRFKTMGEMRTHWPEAKNMLRNHLGDTGANVSRRIQKNWEAMPTSIFTLTSEMAPSLYTRPKNTQAWTIDEEDKKRRLASEIEIVFLKELPLYFYNVSRLKKRWPGWRDRFLKHYPHAQRLIGLLDQSWTVCLDHPPPRVDYPGTKNAVPINSVDGSSVVFTSVSNFKGKQAKQQMHVPGTAAFKADQRKQNQLAVFRAHKAKQAKFGMGGVFYVPKELTILQMLKAAHLSEEGEA